MKLLNRFIGNKLIKEGYSSDVAQEIVTLVNKYPKAIDFVDDTYSVDDIKEIYKFFDSQDAPLIYFVSNLDNDKKLLIVKAYNRRNTHLSNSPKTWKLITKIAKEYDADILKVVLDQIVSDTPNYDFMNLVITALDQNVNLNDLDFFKNGKSRTK